MSNKDIRICFIVFQIIYLIFVESKTYETDRKESNEFLNTKFSFRSKYEQSRETIEITRESCLDEYRQQQKLSHRRQALSPVCAQYCTETMDCEEEKEQLACVNPLYPSWPTRTLKYTKKFERICYIRITEVLRYESAEQLCRKHGLELAVIDNMPLLERLKQMNMFNTTCKGQCPETRGYYIGLKRQMDRDGLSESKWIWSNNVTWMQNKTDCEDEYTNTSFTNANFLCYTGLDGQKKVTVWNIGEPNNYRSSIVDAGEQCVEIIARPDKNGSYEQIGRLNDIRCIKPALGVICQTNDLKPVNTKRFESFATIVGFNETEVERDEETQNKTEGIDLVNNLLSSFDGSIAMNLNAVAKMTAGLEGLLALSSFTNKQANNVFNVIDQLIDITGQINVEDDSLKEVTNKLLHFLDLFAAKIEIDDKDEQSTSFHYENMDTVLVNLNLDQQIQENNDNGWFTLKSNTSDGHPNTITQLNIQALQAYAESTDNYRIIETVFSNFNLFPQLNRKNGSTSKQLLGMPISYQLANWTTIKIDEDLIRFQIRVSTEIQTRNISCIYWSFDENNGSWIEDDGCRFVGYTNDYAQCYCNHLTHFALLLLPESEQFIEPLSTIEEFILLFVTYLGIGLSIFGLVITLITYLLFRRSKKNYLHYSLFMLCVSILCVNCLYIPFSLTKPEIGRYNYCNIVGFLFHYFIISSFMWMLIMASIQYMYFVQIFNTHISHFVTKTTLFGWILPLMFPILVVSIGINGGYKGQTRCWIHDEILRYITFLAPISIIVLCNLILFIIILKSLFRRDPDFLTHQNNRSKLQMSAAVCCFVSIGCTWAFGILVLIRPSFIHQLIFCISNSLQGFLIFIFHVYLSKPKRDLWKTFFIQRGLHQRSNLSDIHAEHSSASDSSAKNFSGLSHPMKIRTTATSANNQSSEGISTTNRSYPDHDRNILLTPERLQPGRIAHLVLHPQPDFLYDRIRRAKMDTNNHYA
ncbi:hypothetical protein I4U23_019458 [Adineta vaga]|nr:hypothetical protein I4U23_019458 [Adineta vaga]